MRPPIPPPDGSVTPSTPDDLKIPTEAARVIYQGTGGWLALTRFTFKQFFSLPICWLIMPLILLTLPLSLPMTVLVNHVLIVSRGVSTTALGREGVWDVGNIWSYFIAWKRVLFVFNWSGDVAIITFGGGSMIPREAFASPDEAREFTQIARELRKSRGAAWREEWKGKVFGKTA